MDDVGWFREASHLYQSPTECKVKSHSLVEMAQTASIETPLELLWSMPPKRMLQFVNAKIVTPPLFRQSGVFVPCFFLSNISTISLQH